MRVGGLVIGCVAACACAAGVQETLNPVWEDTFTFVVEKPLGTKVILDIFDGEDTKEGFMGQAREPPSLATCVPASTSLQAHQADLQRGGLLRARWWCPCRT